MPYNIDKKLGGDSKENIKFMEDCIDSISGTNKRTGKPYTEGEKIAICKAALKRKKSSNSALDSLAEEIDFDKVERILFAYSWKAYQAGRAATLSTAYYLAEAALAKCNYNIDYLETII